MKALIIGATGATGKDLVNMLLKDQDYKEVVTFVRRKGTIVHTKLKEIITDFEKLEDVEKEITGDVFFSCLGTTLKDAGSKEKQWHIDYEIPLQFAERAKRNGISKAVLLSAYGASPNSSVFYSKMKGQLEQGFLKLGFNQCIIFKPGMLERKDTDRLGAKLITPIIKLINKMGLMRKFRPLKTFLLAEKLAKGPKILSSGQHVIELDKIFDF